MKSLKPVMDIRFLQAIRIDWRAAVKEAEDIMNSNMNDLNLPLEEKLKSVEMFKEINHLYGNDDMDNYIVYLDKHFKELKPNIPIIFIQPQEERKIQDGYQ